MSIGEPSNSRDATVPDGAARSQIRLLSHPPAIVGSVIHEIADRHRSVTKHHENPLRRLAWTPGSGILSAYRSSGWTATFAGGMDSVIQDGVGHVQ